MGGQGSQKLLLWRGLHSSPERQRASGSAQPQHLPQGALLRLSLVLGAVGQLVRQSPFFPPCGRIRRHHVVAPWPLLALPFWPLRSLPPTCCAAFLLGLMPNGALKKWAERSSQSPLLVAAAIQLLVADFRSCGYNSSAPGGSGRSHDGTAVRLSVSDSRLWPAFAAPEIRLGFRGLHG
jgi:hypothetical protein